MPDTPSADGAGKSEPEKSRPEKTETPAERRRRLAEVFGEVLPETTRDEREDGSGGGAGRGRDGEDPGERWLKEQVPPHHG